MQETSVSFVSRKYLRPFGVFFIAVLASSRFIAVLAALRFNEVLARVRFIGLLQAKSHKQKITQILRYKKIHKHVTVF